MPASQGRQRKGSALQRVWSPLLLWAGLDWAVQWREGGRGNDTQSLVAQKRLAASPNEGRGMTKAIGIHYLPQKEGCWLLAED